MQLGLPLFLVAAVAATAAATTLLYVPNQGVGVWVRRIFLVLLNLNPMTIGTWRSEFSKRETFLATWFLVFVVLLFTVPLFAPCQPVKC
jgi:hypothetical protein